MPRNITANVDANNNILPPGYTIPLGYDDWAQPFRVNRIREMLAAGKKFDMPPEEHVAREIADNARLGG